MPKLQVQFTTRLASVDIRICVDTSRARTGADLLRLVAWRCSLEFLTDNICASDAGVGNRSSVAKVRVDTDKCSRAAGCFDAVNLDVAFTLLWRVRT